MSQIINFLVIMYLNVTFCILHDVVVSMLSSESMGLGKSQNPMLVNKWMPLET